MCWDLPKALGAPRLSSLIKFFGKNRAKLRARKFCRFPDKAPQMRGLLLLCVCQHLEHVADVAGYAELVSSVRTNVVNVDAKAEAVAILSVYAQSAAVSPIIKHLG